MPAAHEAPAVVGASVEAIDTPALVVDLDAMERNLDRMAALARAAGVRLRPHAKTHKCAAIALRQVARGAVGVCCQKVGEAAALVAHGVQDVLVSNEVVDPRKLGRLAALARHATVGVCVDDASVVPLLDAAARAHDVRLDVLVEVDVGGNRCGVSTPAEAVALAERVAATSRLTFGGLQAYHGTAQHRRTPAERGAASAESAGIAARVVEALAARGLACAVVGGAGTGTFALDMRSGVYTEIQPGSYVFMDADYARNEPLPDDDGAPLAPFEQSLFVLTQVMSAPGRGFAIVDAGLKALSVDSGMPTVAGRADVPYGNPSDEHGKLALGDSGWAPRVGERVRLVPGHCDPTVNLHDWIVATRDGVVVEVWPVVARGPGH